LEKLIFFLNFMDDLDQCALAVTHGGLASGERSSTCPQGDDRQN
jgi:hypothetical protein